MEGLSSMRAVRLLSKSWVQSGADPLSFGASLRSLSG